MYMCVCVHVCVHVCVYACVDKSAFLLLELLNTGMIPSSFLQAFIQDCLRGRHQGDCSGRGDIKCGCGHDTMRTVLSINMGTNRTLLVSTSILLPVLGIAWAFGILAVNVNTTVFAWLFTIFNSFQVTDGLHV